ncbi:hypothetical protein B0H10DRAFT_2077311 [Mycena sp. CBHHK59/15]|nr:hypothetical protein B0H10DRAFT_2102085 [Mycena sp. CBHHK59/15]KAJ6579879.1 hypothetical protein B0H10DRAFT_2099362 [Mycena sp. CBHHK59/15]KAJ6586769.1 hypothetical protein B0H10DRAFT_2094438 [Mycena sp. CBHHK59/15]KAJ6605039.1 hypothetical protein B0H10DRAFT_2077311 [Mycena sp. CBHHK59/15]
MIFCAEFLNGPPVNLQRLLELLHALTSGSPSHLTCRFHAIFNPHKPENRCKMASVGGF